MDDEIRCWGGGDTDFGRYSQLTDADCTLGADGTYSGKLDAGGNYVNLAIYEVKSTGEKDMRTELKESTSQITPSECAQLAAAQGFRFFGLRWRETPNTWRCSGDNRAGTNGREAEGAGGCAMVQGVLAGLVGDIFSTN